MEVLTSEEVRRGQVPAGARVLELVSEGSECAAASRFSGVECLSVAEIEGVRSRFSAHEPILIHCRRPGECAQAARELGRMGYSNVYRYEGSLEELGPAVSGQAAAVPSYAAPIITQDEVERLLQTSRERVHLLRVVADRGECQAAAAGVECVAVNDLVAEGLPGINREDTIVLRCGLEVDCQAAASGVRDTGFGDVRIFEGDYGDIGWLQRM